MEYAISYNTPHYICTDSEREPMLEYLDRQGYKEIELSLSKDRLHGILSIEDEINDESFDVISLAPNIIGFNQLD